MKSKRFIHAFIYMVFFGGGLAAPVLAVDYSDFPLSVREHIDNVISDIQAEGGAGIAGRVTFSDGASIGGNEDVLMNYRYHVLSAGIIHVFDDGWFVMTRRMNLNTQLPPYEIRLRAFGYDPIDQEVTLTDGEMNYFDIELQWVPPEERGSLSGTVLEENGNEFPGVEVNVHFPLVSLKGRSPELVCVTNANGEYSFEGLTDCGYRVTADNDYYAYDRRRVDVPTGGSVEADLQLFPKRTIQIEYVYQPSGAPEFFGEGLMTGASDWESGTHGMDFSTGVCTYYGDLRLYQNYEDLNFRCYYYNGYNGVYPEGAVPFESVLYADESRISIFGGAVEVGNVYVVRTLEDLNYAKFVVLSNRYSFRSIAPVNPDPIEYPEYGLTVDFYMVRDQGRLYVKKLDTVSTIPDAVALPDTYKLYVVTGALYAAVLHFTYDEAVLEQLGLDESNLLVYRSRDNGVTWQVQPTQQDYLNNVLTVTGQSTFGLYAIAWQDAPSPADLDADGDADLADFSIFQACFTGEEIPQDDPDCLGALLDDDSDVDLGDFAIFEYLMDGPQISR